MLMYFVPPKNLVHSYISVLFQPYLCESFYVLLEYARTAMFFWFFIEGLHLHNVLTMDVFIDGAETTRRFVFFNLHLQKKAMQNGTS